GIVAVLICIDIERPELVRELLEQKPILMLNPAHIPDSKVDEDEQKVASEWRYSMTYVVEKYEQMLSEVGCSLIRVDNPRHVGRGLSTAATPCCTRYANTPYPHFFTIFVNSNPEELSFCKVMKPPDYARSLMKDNTCSRYELEKVVLDQQQFGL